MTDMILLLRVIHIVFGVLRFGRTATIGFFFHPAARAAGPNGEVLSTPVIGRAPLLMLIAIAGVMQYLPTSLSMALGELAPVSPFRRVGIRPTDPSCSPPSLQLARSACLWLIARCAREPAGRRGGSAGLKPKIERTLLTKRLTTVTQFSVPLRIATVAFMVVGHYI